MESQNGRYIRNKTVVYKRIKITTGHEDIKKQNKEQQIH